MCGRFTVKMTWAEIVALYRLTLDRPPHNLQSRYNVCPTDPIDVVTERDGNRDLVRMRWGLVPWWWPKPLKELRATTFNARAETVKTSPSPAMPSGVRAEPLLCRLCAPEVTMTIWQVSPRCGQSQ
jgi:putative SOS response-associated peptidase YedK